MAEHSTDDADYEKFRPHGRVEFSIVEDRMILSRAIGPFNVELFQALKQIEPGVIEEAKIDDGKWCEIVVFEQSCMSTDELIDELGVYIKVVKESGDAPLAAAYVFPKDIESTAYMKEMYKKCYEEAGIPCSIFSNEEDAIRWVKTYLTP